MQLQLFFDKQLSEKMKQKDLLESYKRELESRKEYVQLVSDIKELKDRKQMIEVEVKDKIGLELIEDVKVKIKHLGESMTAEAIEALKKGEEVKVKDAFGKEYIAVWSVRFKKKKQEVVYDKDSKEFKKI